MKNFFIKHRYLIILFICISVISAFIFLPYIFSDTEFVLGWDMRSLYSSNFNQLRNMLQHSIQTGELPFYSWNSFLGNDYYSSKLFYFQDIFDYPFALLTNWSFYKVIIIQTYIKFLVAGFSFYLYCKFHKYSGKTSVIGSLIFAFSAYGLQTMMHPFFGSFFVFIPLYFLAMDRYIFSNKKISYILITAFMFINNYYLFYSVSLFSILYFIFQYYTKHQTYKGFLKNALPLIGCYFIGLMLSGFVVIPEVLNVLGNERVGSSSSVLFYNSLLPYFDYFSGIFTPTSVLANRNTAITPIYSYVSANESVMAVFLWCSSITTLIFPQLFSKKNRKSILTISIVIISLFALVPCLSSVMHGFSEPSFRWLQSPLFLLIICILPFVEGQIEIDKKLLKKTFYIVIVLLVVTTPLIAICTGYNFKSMISDYLLVIMFIPTLIILYYAIVENSFKILLVGLTVELSLAGYFSFIASPYFSEFSKDTINKVHHVLLEKDDYNNYLLSLDSTNQYQFYRSYVDPSSVYWDVSLNLNLDFNIMGLISYDSTYASSANDMKKIAPVEAYLPWTFNIQDNNVMNLVSTKYAIVTNETQVPFEYFEKVGEFNYLSVYENKDYVSLGKTYSNAISYDEYVGNTDILKESLVVYQEDLSEIQSYLGNTENTFNTVIRKQNSLYAEITTDENEFVLLSIPYDKGWTITVNGNEINPYRVSGGLMGLPLEKGNNVIQMNFIPYGLKIGIVTTLVGVILLFLVSILKLKRNQIKKH